MTPRPVDVASVQAKLRSLDELLGALRLVGEVDGARLGQDVLLRLAVERALTQAVDLVVAVCSHVVAACMGSTRYGSAAAGSPRSCPT